MIFHGSESKILSLEHFLCLVCGKMIPVGAAEVSQERR